MTKIILIFLMCCLSSMAFGQTMTPELLMNKVSRHYQELENGAYWVSYRYQIGADKDTSKTKQATIYFYRKDAIESDSVVPFVWKISNREWQVYDGKNLYIIDHKKKKIQLSPLDNVGGIVGYLSQLDKAIGMCLFGPQILTTTFPANPKYPLSCFRKQNIQEIQRDGQQYWEFVTADTFHITRSSITGALSTDSGIMHKKLLVDAQYAIREKTFFIDADERVDTWEQSKYHYYPLPADSATFEQVFNLEQLKTLGYEMKDLPVKSSQGQVTAGDVLPDLTVWKSNGKSFQLSKIAGDRIVVLDFWFANCTPCIAGMPSISKVYQKYLDQGVTVVSINPVDRQYEAVEKYIKAQGAIHPTLFMDRADAEKIGIKTYPKILIVDAKTRKVLKVYQGRRIPFDEDLGTTIELYLK